MKSSIFPLFLFAIFLIFSLAHSYLLFHTTVELFSIVVAASTFMFAWNTRKISKNNYFLFLGIAYLFVGVIGFLHTMAYKGLNVFAGAGANLPTQLWIANRYLLAVSILIAPLFIFKKVRAYIVVVIYLIITSLIIASIFYWRIFPESFREGVGLTHFKVVSEYIISLFFLISTITLFFLKSKFDKKVFFLLASAFFLNIVCELTFTLYVGVYDFFNMLGHLFQLLAFYAIYKAIIEVGLTRPYDLLFLELKRADKQKDEFISIASHEIKNPLTSIKLASSLLARRYDLQDVKQINTEADKINSLVNDLMDVSRIESGRLKFSMETFDLKNLIDDTIETCRHPVKDHKISITCPKEKISVRGDSNRLGQVLTNLIVNAVKYSPVDSKVIITAKITSGLAVISVQDFGIGIPKNDQTRIFQKYYRTGKSERYAAGLGLGLYISKEIVSAHNGKIWVESKKGKGSTFFVSLPYP